MMGQAEIERVAREIGRVANAEQVVLFGSYATGQMREDSDLDFLVVAESDLPRHKRSREIYMKVRPGPVPMDIVVYTPEEVRQCRQSPISFVAQLFKEGKTVYER
jgi:uncharacterized protein